MLWFYLLEHRSWTGIYLVISLILVRFACEVLHVRLLQWIWHHINTESVVPSCSENLPQSWSDSRSLCHPPPRSTGHLRSTPWMRPAGEVESKWGDSTVMLFPQHKALHRHSPHAKIYEEPLADTRCHPLYCQLFFGTQTAACYYNICLWKKHKFKQR